MKAYDRIKQGGKEYIVYRCEHRVVKIKSLVGFTSKEEKEGKRHLRVVFRNFLLDHPNYKKAGRIRFKLRHVWEQNNFRTVDELRGTLFYIEKDKAGYPYFY